MPLCNFKWEEMKRLEEDGDFVVMAEDSITGQEVPVRIEKTIIEDIVKRAESRLNEVN